MNKKAVGVVAAIVVLVCAISILRSLSSGRASSPDDDGAFLMELGAPVFFVCEKCEAETHGSFRPTPFRCEKCGEEAMVERARYECTCGKRFEAFRRRSVMSSDGKRPVGFDVKLPGGTWRRMRKPPVKCPACGNEDPATLKPIAPPLLPPAPPPSSPELES